MYKKERYDGEILPSPPDGNPNSSQRVLGAPYVNTVRSLTNVISTVQ